MNIREFVVEIEQILVSCTVALIAGEKTFFSEPTGL